MEREETVLKWVVCERAISFSPWLCVLCAVLCACCVLSLAVRCVLCVLCVVRCALCLVRRAVSVGSLGTTFR